VSDVLGVLLTLRTGRGRRYLYLAAGHYVAGGKGWACGLG